MATITQEQFGQLLQNAPKGTDAGSLRASLIKRGHTVEDAPAPKKNIAGKASNILGAIFGGNKVGELIGAQIAKAGLPEDQRQFVTSPSAGQVAADVGLTALSLTPIGIPGRIAAKVGIPAVRGLASGASLGRNVLEGAALGSAMGVTAAEKEGRTPETGDVALGALGAAIPLAGKAVELTSQATRAIINSIKPAAAQMQKDLAGIGVQTENILRELPSDAKFNTYVTAAKARANDVRAASPIGKAAEEVEKAGKIIQGKVKAAGKAVGAARQAARDTAVKVSDDVRKGFVASVEERFGLSLKKSGLFGAIKGSLRTVAASEKNRIQRVEAQLKKLTKSATVARVTDVIRNLDELVDYSKVDQFGQTLDPLEGLLKQTRGKLNELIREAAPGVAKANDRFAALKELEEFLGASAGKELQRGELLLRRVFSGDKARDTLSLFDAIKKETKKDLVQDAVLARLTTEMFGDASQQTLLQQIIEGGAQQGRRGITSALTDKAFSIAQKNLAEPEAVARSIIGREAPQSTPMLSTNVPPAVKTRFALFEALKAAIEN